MGLIASNPKMTTEKKLTDYGSIEEKTIVETGNVPSKKSVIKYDFAGLATEKAIFQWDSQNSSWVAVHKRSYSYNLQDQKMIVAFTKWDGAKDKWSADTDIATYDIKDNRILSMADSVDKKAENLK